MPNLPKPRLPRTARSRAAAVVAPPEDQHTPRVEVVEGADGLRWIKIDAWRAAERTWLEEHFDFHPLDYEDVGSRNQRPKVDEYDGYLFVVLQFPRYDKSVGRLNAAEVDVFVGPDWVLTIPNQPLPPLDYLFDRCRNNDETRQQLFSNGSGYLLYRVVDQCVDASFPMLRKVGNKLERLEEDVFEGRSYEVVRDIFEVKQEIINFRKVIRPMRTAVADLERTKRYIPEDLDIYFDDINDAWNASDCALPTTNSNRLDFCPDTARWNAKLNLLSRQIREQLGVPRGPPVRIPEPDRRAQRHRVPIPDQQRRRGPAAIRRSVAVLQGFDPLLEHVDRTVDGLRDGLDLGGDRAPGIAGGRD